MIENSMDTQPQGQIFSLFPTPLYTYKLENKEYVRFSGYPGGQRFTSAESMLKNNPERLIEKAVKGMLPKNALGRKLFTNLKVYAGETHKHQAQQAETLNLDTLK